MLAADVLYPPAASANAFDLAQFIGRSDIDVWPDCWDAVVLFRELGTQWRYAGMGDRAGMDYGVLFSRLRQLGYHGEQREQMFQDMRVMESRVLHNLSNSHGD